MLGFVLILYFESLHMKTQLQFLSDTFLSTLKDYGGFLSLSKNVVTMFFLCGTVFFWWERCFSVRQTSPADVQLMENIWRTCFPDWLGLHMCARLYLDCQVVSGTVQRCRALSVLCRATFEGFPWGIVLTGQLESFRKSGLSSLKFFHSYFCCFCRSLF